MAGRLVLLALEINGVFLQLPDFRPLVFQEGVGGEDLLPLQRRPHLVAQLRQHRLMGDHGQVQLQEIFALIPQLLDEVEGIEDGQENIPLAKHVRQVQLANLIAVKGDGHAAVPPGAGEGVGWACLIHEAQADRHVGVDLVVQPVDAPLAEKGLARDGKGDGVGDAGLAYAVAAGDDGPGPEGQLGGLLVGLEARQGHAGDLKLLDFLHNMLLSHAAWLRGSTIR